MKKLLLSASFFTGFYFLSMMSSAGQEIEWQNTIQGTAIDDLIWVEQTSDGGYILGGTSGSGIGYDKTENTNGGYDFWIVKTDASGTIQWQNTIGGSGTEYFYSIQQCADGGYILGGSSTSNISGDKTENCIGGNDYWLIKTDATGGIQWENTIGGNDLDQLKSVRQTLDGGSF